MRSRSLAKLGVVWLLALWGPGCAEIRRAGVQGTVTVDGHLLREGEIAFVPLDAQLGPTAGARILNGAYRIAPAHGPFAGDYLVRIHAFRKSGRKVWDGMGDDKAPAAQKGSVEIIEMYLPARFNAATELRATIRAGTDNDCHFELNTVARQ